MVYIIRDYDKKKETEKFIEEQLEKVSNCVDVRGLRYDEVVEMERRVKLRKAGSGVVDGVVVKEINGSEGIRVVGQLDEKLDGSIVSENFVFSKSGRLIGKGKISK